MIDISKLEPADRDRWQVMFGEFLRCDGPADRYDLAWSRLQDDAEIHALGARIDGELVGFAHFFSHAHTNAPDVCCLHHLFTSPAHRGRGVARALVDGVASWARQRGCSRVYWVVHEANAVARRLYDRVASYDGFIEYRMTIDESVPGATAPPGVDVGRLHDDDRARWEALFRAYIDFYERELPDREYDRAWARVLADEEIHALGARIDGRLEGIVHFLEHPHTNLPDVCYLQDLFTDPSARGRGVARALIVAVAERARQRGCGRVYWATRDTNGPARALYDQLAEHDGSLVYRMAL